MSGSRGGQLAIGTIQRDSRLAVAGRDQPRQTEHPERLEHSRLIYDSVQVNSQHNAVAARLEATPNPLGQGMLVFVRTREDCGPEYFWVTDGELGHLRHR
jgi:hypothetical protein